MIEDESVILSVIQKVYRVAGNEGIREFINSNATGSSDIDFTEEELRIMQGGIRVAMLRASTPGREEVESAPKVRTQYYLRWSEGGPRTQ